MKNRRKLFCLLASVILLTGCKKDHYKMNEEFTLNFNKTATVKMDGEAYPIQFTKLIEESRCPPDVNCFWQGQVAVKIKINNETDIEIGLNTTIPSTATFKNHTIRLLEVNYDSKPNFGLEEHCSIKLRVDE
jgi:hypothetical protein